MSDYSSLEPKAIVPTPTQEFAIEKAVIYQNVTMSHIRIRTCPGILCSVADRLPPGKTIELCESTQVIQNEITWMQVAVSGYWIAVKNQTSVFLRNVNPGFESCQA